MTDAPRACWLMVGVALLLALALTVLPAQGQAPGLGLGGELVDAHVLRVCADPNDLPFSNQAEQGFENRIAGVLAKEMNKKLAFAWQPQVFGFLRLTLYNYQCDVVMGIAQGNNEVQNSSAYYRSVYALVYRPHTGFDDIQSLEDPRLRGKHIGVIAGTPPTSILADNDLLDHVHAYQLSVNLRFFSPARDLTDDLRNEKIDVGILWGPIAGYFASHSDGTIAIAPLLHESDQEPPMMFGIVMGVRHGDDAWRRQLNEAIENQRPAIERILQSYGVPLLDDRNRLIFGGG